MKRFIPDYFILGLLSVLILSFFFSHIGTSTHPINLQKVAGYGISVIFFFYGLKLNPKKILQDLQNIKLHLVVQISVFILAPILALLIKPLFTNTELWFSIFFFSALPSTVSSAIVMVSIAKGNITSAIFNATVSSFAGIFITPLLMGIALHSSTFSFDATHIVTQLTLQIIAPIVAGFLLHAKFGHIAQKFSKQLKYLDQSIVLLIVFTSFSKSYESNAFQNISPTQIALLIVGMLLFFIVIYSTILYSCRLLHFSQADTICATFCGSTKSLIHGVALSKVLFAGTPIIGIILIPIMIYHSIQIFIISIIAKKYGSKNI